MSNRPFVKPGDWIQLGIGPMPLNAVVCTVYKVPKNDGDVEVVYLDDRKRAINENVVWKEDHWEFWRSGPGGGYADKYDRLSEFVNILKGGKY